MDVHYLPGHMRTLMKILPFILVFALFGCRRPPELACQRIDREVRQWVPVGTPLASAQKIMEQHQFTCFIHSYTNRQMMTNLSEAVCWLPGVGRLNGTDVVTNVTLLQCRWIDKRNASKECGARITVINGTTSGGLSVYTLGL